MQSVPLFDSAFHPLDRPRDGHRRVRSLTAAELHQPLEVTLVLRERPAAPSVAHTLAWLNAHRGDAPRLSEQQVVGLHGPAPVDRAAVFTLAHANNVRVIGDDALTRRITLRGATGRMAELFGVELERFRWDAPRGSVEYRGHLGPVRVPPAIAGAVSGVFGLDDRPIAASHVRAPSPGKPAIISYDPPEVAALYDYPRLPRGGAGLHLVAGMIELGGTVHTADVDAAFTRLGLRPPRIVNVAVDGALPEADPEGADVEVALDYQVLGAMVLAMAPRADLTIVVYNAPNCERGFLDAVATVAGDRVHRPTAVSISWGSSEERWSQQGLRAMDTAFATAALRGVTISAAAGDAGSTDAVTDGRQHAEFPASSPHVWACGGTTLFAIAGHVVSETVWNELELGAGAGGSGVSRFFAPPRYQLANGVQPRRADIGTAGRGLPDGSGVADPVTGWNILALGRRRITGGTSAVAPMYTALWTLIGGLRERGLGMPHPAAYAARGRGFRDIVVGNTGGPYTARRGWDTATGWGTPRGRELARQLGVPARRLGGVHPRPGGPDELEAA